MPARLPRGAAHTLLAAACATAAVIACGVAAWPFTVDDAYVVLRIAEHLRTGQGWAMNPGVASDAVTGPLWIAPFSTGEAVAGDGMVLAKGAGLACAALAAGLAVWAVGRRSAGRCAAWIAVVVIAVQPTIGIWSVAGLETGAATLAMVVAALGALRRPRGSWLAVGGAAGAIAWLRPELLVASWVLVGALLLRDRRRGALAAGLGLAGLLAVAVFRWAMFERVLPLAFDAKPGVPGLGAEYAVLALVVTTGVLGVLLALAGVRSRGAGRVIAAAVVAHVAAVIVAGGDWMPGFRLMAPVLPLYAMLVAWGVVALWRVRAHPAGRRRLRRILVTGLLGIALAIPVLDLVAQIPEVRAAGERREHEGRELARWLREHGDSVALVDVGYLGWASGLRVIDLGGITDEEVARAPGGHLAKEFDPGWLQLQAPDLIVLHTQRPWSQGDPIRELVSSPVELRAAWMPWVREHYRACHVVEYAPSYWYVVLCASRGRDAIHPRDSSRKH